MSQRRRTGKIRPPRQGRPRQQPATPPPPERRRSRDAPAAERKIPKSLLIATGVFLVAIVVGVIVNYWVSEKRPGDVPVLQVNNKLFTWNDYVGLLKFSSLGAQYVGQRFDSGGAPYELVNTMAENELVRQAAAREGIKVADEMVEAEMLSRMVPNPVDPDNQEQVKREFEVALGGYLTATQVSRAEYRDIVLVDLIREGLRQKLGETVPRVQAQAYVHMIRAVDEEADQVEALLNEGEDFSVLARKFSTERNAKENAGALGWVPRLVLKDLDLALFGLRIGEISDPYKTDEGWWLIRIDQRTDEGAFVHGILVDASATARDVKRRVESGSAFENAVAEFSIHQESKDRGGDLGLIKIGDRSGDFDLLIRGIALDEVSERIGTSDGTVWLKVTARTGAKEIDDDGLNVLKTRRLEDWLLRERDANLVNYCPGSPDNCFSNTKVDRALQQIRDISLTRVQEGATATAVAIRKAQQQPRFPG